MPWFFRRPARADQSAPAAAAASICPRCRATNPLDARYCNQCGLALRPAADATDAIPAPVTPPHPATSDERRIVTVLFADITNSTGLAETLEVEELRGLLSDYFRLMAEQIRRHGGIVEKFIGDAVMGVFGLPRSHEDDPIRAVRAALDMQAELSRWNEERQAIRPGAPALTMRIGVNTGNVVAAAAEDRRDFLVTGDPVNVAARLQQGAEPGSVVVGPRTYRDVRSAVLAVPLPAAELKGKARPIRAWEVRGMRDANPVPLARARSLEPPQTTLVGREVEMRLLLNVYDRVSHDRRPHIVTIVGAPGIGKTRLAREFLATIAETDPEPEILIGRTALYGESITYWPLVEILRDFCDIAPTTGIGPPSGIGPPGPLDEARDHLLAGVRQALTAAGSAEDPVSIAQALAIAIGLEPATPDHPTERGADLTQLARHSPEKMIHPWRVFFEAIATVGPLVIMIDDIQWADPSLLTLLEAVMAPTTPLPIMLLCTARTELFERSPNAGWPGSQSGKSDHLHLALEPLKTEQSAQLMTDLLGGASLPDEMRASILQRAEGNPFFVEEIVRMLIDRGILVRDDVGSTDLPPGDSGSPADPPTPSWEVLGSWTEAAGGSGADGSSEMVIPDTVQGVLAARLDLLTPPEREVLRHAAIIGRTFWPGAILGMAPELTRGEVLATLEDLARKDLVTLSAGTAPGDTPSAPGEPRYSFKHILTRDVVYDTMSRSRRAQEHLRFATWLESFATGAGRAADLPPARDRLHEYAEWLARHYEEYYRQSGLAHGSEIDREEISQQRHVILHKAITYLDMTGDSAIERHAAQAAIRAFSRALALLEEDAANHIKDPERRHLFIVLNARRGDARALRSDGDGAWRDYQEALRWWLRADAHAESATIREERATGMRLYRRLVTLPTRYPSWFRNPPLIQELQGYLTAGLRLAEEADEPNSLDRVALLTAKTFFWWSWPQGRGQAQLRDALASAEEAVRIAELLDAPREASVALDALGNMQATITDLRGHLASQARRLFWARRIEDHNEIIDIHSEVSAAHQMLGEYPRAVYHANVALEEAARYTNEILRSQALQRLVIAYFEWDRFKEAIARGVELQGLAARVTVSRQNHYRWAMLALALAYLHTDQPDHADQVLRQLAELPPIFESQYVVVMRGRVQVALGAEAEAIRIFQDALSIRAGRHSQPMLLAELAELGALLDNAELTATYGARAVTLAERSGARKPLAQALRARSGVALQAGRTHEAWRDLQAALNIFDALGTRWESARTQVVMAAYWQRRGPAYSDSTQSALNRAIELFEQVGARHDAQRCRAALESGQVTLR